MKRGGGISGAVSLVMIFCVLCLAVFAALTLSTSNRERQLAELTAARAAEYYGADRRAVEWVAGLTEMIPVSNIPDGAVVANSFPVGEDQALEVELQYGMDKGAYKILRWQTVYTGDWTPDNTIKVWDGN